MVACKPVALSLDFRKHCSKTVYVLILERPEVGLHFFKLSFLSNLCLGLQYFHIVVAPCPLVGDYCFTFSIRWIMLEEGSYMWSVCFSKQQFCSPNVCMNVFCFCIIWPRVASESHLSSSHPKLHLARLFLQGSAQRLAHISNSVT